MKINCDYFKERRRLKQRAQFVWHDWFAWYPVRIGPGDCRWLETVECCREWCRLDYMPWSYWNYRAKEG